MAKGGKQAKFKEPSVDKKTKFTSDPDNMMKKHPSWGFSAIDNEKWCIKDSFNEVVDSLKDFERMTWAEISSAPKSGGATGSKSHFIVVNEICKEAQQRLQEMNLHYDTLYSLRLSGRKRVIGILENGILKIIWYDSNHSIWN